MAYLTVKLGPYWQRFVPSAQGLVLLGSVQQDAAIGALARSSDEGTYWQINGDHRRKLNTSQVEAAVRVAEQWLSGSTGKEPTTSPPERHLPPPTVTVKRKRVLAMPDETA